MQSLSRNDQNTSEELIQEFLDNGGTITKCPPHERSENVTVTGGMWGRKKTAQPKEDTK